jgi:hypothetical protein
MEDSSLAQLDALVKVPGALQIITAEHDHQGDCSTSQYSLEDPKHFVCHDVASIEVLENGLVKASSAEGDWTVGSSADVLKRLQQAGS